MMDETVECWIYVYDGLEFPISQVCVTIRPVEEAGFALGIAADATYENAITTDAVPFPSDRIEALLRDIRKNDPEKWAQIESAARQNSRPDYDEDREPVSYAAHYIEDHYEVTTCPR